MSRTPAREALIASGAVSVVISLCVLGGIVTGGPADATAQTATTSTVRPPSTATAGDHAAMSGSHSGVWFSLDTPTETSTKTLAQQAALMRAAELSSSALSSSALSSSALSSSEMSSSGNSAGAAPAATATQSPVAAQTPALRRQSRSSVLAAVSGQPREVARTLAATHGWTGSQWSCLDNLWNHESQYETTARNARSGAYGIPQALPATKMAAAGVDWKTNPVTQIVWGLNYISARYGSPCGAWSYWVRHYSY